MAQRKDLIQINPDACPLCKEVLTLKSWPYCRDAQGNETPGGHGLIDPQDAQMINPIVRFEDPKFPGKIIQSIDERIDGSIAVAKGYTKRVELRTIKEIRDHDRQITEFEGRRHQIKEAVRIAQVEEAFSASQKRLGDILKKDELKKPEKYPELIESTGAGKAFVSHMMEERRKIATAKRPAPVYSSEIMETDASNRIPYRDRATGKEKRD